MPSAEAPVEHGEHAEHAGDRAATPPTAFGTTCDRKSDTDVTSPSTRWISSPGVCGRWNSWSRPSTWRVMRSRSSLVVPHAVIVAKRVTVTPIDLGGDGDGEEQQGEADERRRACAPSVARSTIVRTTSGPASASAERRARSAPRTAQRRASGRRRASRARPRDGEGCRHAAQSPARSGPDSSEGFGSATRCTDGGSPRPGRSLRSPSMEQRHRHPRGDRRASRTSSSRRSCWSRRSRSTGCAASTDVARHLMLDRRLALDPQVALRPEPFGALAYHYGNRRLIFLKHPDVVRVVRGARRPRHRGRRAAPRATSPSAGGRRSSTALESLERRT